MFLTGPEVIKSVTGEVVDFESLGGAEVHLGGQRVGAPDSATEQEALAQCRRVLSYLPSNNIENPPFAKNGDDPQRMDAELNALVPLDPGEPYSMHDAIAAHC
jgi:methylmalonyl-CoA decarboxylase subunit alpha